MKDFSVAIGILFLLLVFFVLWLVSWASFTFGHTNGYCYALGGSPIGMSNVCDVNGTVVEVK